MTQLHEARVNLCGTNMSVDRVHAAMLISGDGTMTCASVPQACPQHIG